MKAAARARARTWSISAWAIPTAAAQACDRQARRGREQARTPTVIRPAAGHSRAAEGAGGLLRAPLRRRPRSRHRGHRHPGLEGRASPISPRRSPRRATSCSRPTRATRSTASASSSPAPRSARSRRRRARNSSSGSTDAMRFTVPRPKVLVIGYPSNPTAYVADLRLLRAAGRLRAGARADGHLRPRLCRNLFRRHADPLDPPGRRARRTSRSSSPRCPRPTRWPAGASASRSATRG